MFIGVSSKIVHCLKAVIELARHYSSGTPVKLEKITQFQNISGKFLLQLMGQLKNAGLVKSLRGMDGGYLLARPPTDISLYDVIKSVNDEKISGEEAHDQLDTLIAEIHSSANIMLEKYYRQLTLANLLEQLMQKEEIIYNI